MNITFVSDSIYPYHKGGKEKRLYELSTRLSKLGHDVHIYTMHWWDEPAKHRLEDGVQLHAISKRYPMYAGDRRTIKQGLLFGLACLRLLRVKFDVLDVDHMPFFPVYSAWFVCLVRRRRLHGTWHEALTRQDWVSYMGPAGHLAHLIEHISIKLPYHITAASERTRRLLGDVHGRKHRVSLVSSGTDAALLTRLKPANQTSDVLYVGRLVKDKHIEKLVAAVAQLVKTRPRLHCTIIGHGIEKKRLQHQVKKLGLDHNIQLLPPLDDAADIYRHMKAARVFCSPSVREGFGIVALEALACGTPVVTTNSPANATRDLITDGKTGSIVPPKADAIAAALADWLDRPRPTGLAKSVAAYDWNRLAARQAESYAS